MIVNIWLIFNALLYIGIGFLSFIQPEKVAATVGFVLSRPGAYAELKACYGGLMIALGLIMLYFMLKNKQLGLLFMAVIYFGFGFGRLLGIIFNQAYDQTTLTYITFEACATILSAILYATYE